MFSRPKVSKSRHLKAHNLCEKSVSSAIILWQAIELKFSQVCRYFMHVEIHQVRRLVFDNHQRCPVPLTGARVRQRSPHDLWCQTFKSGMWLNTCISWAYMCIVHWCHVKYLIDYFHIDRWARQDKRWRWMIQSHTTCTWSLQKAKSMWTL